MSPLEIIAIIVLVALLIVIAASIYAAYRMVKAVIDALPEDLGSEVNYE